MFDPMRVIRAPCNQGVDALLWPNCSSSKVGEPMHIIMTGRCLIQTGWKRNRIVINELSAGSFTDKTKPCEITV
jgi:hypothetical protein